MDVGTEEGTSVESGLLIAGYTTDLEDYPKKKRKCPPGAIE